MFAARHQSVSQGPLGTPLLHVPYMKKGWAGTVPLCLNSEDTQSKPLPEEPSEQKTGTGRTVLCRSPVSPYPLNLGGAILPPKFRGWSV